MIKKNNNVVVITGATAGVGRAAAVMFAREGCKIGLIARDEKRLLQSKEDVEKHGGEAFTFSADVADYYAIENAAEIFEEKLGPIEIWINNAMTTVFSAFKDISPEDFKRVNEVTYMGFVYGTMAALKRMRPRNKGTIVQVGSALAYRGIPLQAAYCGAKHAIQGFTESIRSELLHDKINIYLTMVQMPALNTPQFDWCKSNFTKQPQPVPPIYQPEVAAEAIYYAAYHNRREMYVGFRNTIFLIGNKFFPGFGDRYLASHGYTSQMTDQQIKKDRPTNLYNSVDGDYGAHGRFGDVSIKKSWHLVLNKHPVVTGFLTAAVLVLIVIIIFI